MDNVDSKILNLMQEGIPISEYPFHEMANRLGIKPEEFINRLKAIKDNGYIRRTGAVFNTAKMGYKSTLVGMEVHKERVHEVAGIISGYSQVTHNYYRNNRINIWFTLTASSDEEISLIIQEIACRSRVDKIYEFPKKRLFKLKVYFNMGEG